MHVAPATTRAGRHRCRRVPEQRTAVPAYRSASTPGESPRGRSAVPMRRRGQTLDERIGVVSVASPSMHDRVLEAPRRDGRRRSRALVEGRGWVGGGGGHALGRDEPFFRSSRASGWGVDACWFLHRTGGGSGPTWRRESGAWMRRSPTTRSTKRSGPFSPPSLSPLHSITGVRGRSDAYRQTCARVAIALAERRRRAWAAHLGVRDGRRRVFATPIAVLHESIREEPWFFYLRARLRRRLRTGRRGNRAGDLHRHGAEQFTLYKVRSPMTSSAGSFFETTRELVHRGPPEGRRPFGWSDLISGPTIPTRSWIHHGMIRRA